MFDRFSHVMLYVRQLDRAVKWYSENLGFSINYNIPDAYASLWHEKMNFGLDLHPDIKNSPNIGHGAIAYFSTENFDETIRLLKEKDIRVDEARSEGGSKRFTQFWDCEGNILGLTEL